MEEPAHERWCGPTLLAQEQPGTCNIILPRNGETIRQAVKEVRQLLALFRKRGCPEFGLIGTSFGGWIGALLSFLEKDFSFVALLQPVVDVEKAIWESPASKAICAQLNQASIPAGITRRHAHLTSPKDGRPLCDPRRILLVGGSYDQIVPIDILRNLQDTWPGSRLIEVSQGHFGYAAMGAALQEFRAFLRNWCWQGLTRTRTIPKFRDLG